MRFKIQEEGQWVQPRMKNYYLKCCDCGLTHRVNFRLVKYGNNKRKIQFQMFRCKSLGRK